MYVSRFVLKSSSLSILFWIDTPALLTIKEGVATFSMSGKQFNIFLSVASGALAAGTSLLAPLPEPARPGQRLN